MRIRSFIIFSLLAVLLLASCTPAASSPPSQAEAPAGSVPQMTEEPQAPSPTMTVVPTDMVEAPPTEVPMDEAPQAVATSRGPNLEATDPSSVSLASGDLQLVEFFRFT